MKTRKQKRIFAAIMTAAVFMASGYNVFAVTATIEDSVSDETEMSGVFTLPDIVSSAEAEEYGFVGRNYSVESNLSTFVFENADGNNTMKVYSHPVKYKDENGKVKDITLDLKENTDGSFSTAANSIITTFPRNLSEGILLTYDDISLKMIPDIGNDEIFAEYNKEDRKISYQADDRTAYVYSLTYGGYKEDIVVTDYTGQTDFRFSLYTNGSALNEEEGALFLTDNEDKVTAYLSDVVIHSSDNAHNTLGKMSFDTIKENEQYELTVHVDDDYLRDEATVYPITIDPSITVDSSNNGIDTASIYSNSSSPQGYSQYLRIGKSSSAAKARTLIRFPDLDLSNIHSSLNVAGAKIEMTDITNYQTFPNTSIHVEYCQFNGIWNGNTATWGGLQQDNDAEIYTLLSSKQVNQTNGTNLNPQFRYSFDILPAVKRWVDAKDFDANTSYNVFTPEKGIIFKGTQTLENYTGVKYVTFASCHSSTNSPTLTITFNYGVQGNKYYSRFDPDKVNNEIIPPSQTHLLKYRMNCYGYSFCNIVNGTVNTVPANGDVGYLQQPGEFSTQNRITDVNNKYYYIYQQIETNPYMTNDAFSDEFYDLMLWDAERIGYTIQEYSWNPGSTTLPQYGSNSRLVAMVFNRYEFSSDGWDFHYYTQNSDGTWSHKPGLDNISNCSISDGVILTNDNIWEKANQGDYSGGNLRFFIITNKYAVIDYPFTQKDSAFPFHTTQVSTVFKEIAGEYPETAVDYTIGQEKSCRGDFVKDTDVFRTVPTTTKQFVITAQRSSSLPMQCKVYNNSGFLVASANSSSGSISLNVNMTAGNKYYIAFSVSVLPSNYTFKVE